MSGYLAEALTKGAFAIHVSWMPSAVSNWISRGKLSGCCPDRRRPHQRRRGVAQPGETIDPGMGRPPALELVAAAAIAAGAASC